ncbi:hypothetical protein MKEN_00422500 [Mycena kentingensis (nom. inval.)]|nr:hypothetical protein MKEN_00421500 [Mycena kentingensis (nom. inval.)]KAF7325722.1 hypothetical protein MKEN_00422500 [Mycena kentingensis (nom. inval.)]
MDLESPSGLPSQGSPKKPSPGQISFPFRSATISVAPTDVERLLHALRSYSYECEFERNAIAMRIHQVMLQLQHLRNAMNEAEAKLEGAREDIGTARHVIYSTGLNVSLIETCTTCKDVTYAEV